MKKIKIKNLKIKNQISTTILIVFILQTVQMFAQSNSIVADKILGVYWSPKKDAKIEIYKKGNEYFGKSIWVANPKKDIENPIKELQKRDILGIELLTNFKFINGEYLNGQIYDPESGKTYDCKMSIIGKKLKVRGYIGISLLGRTEFFEHIDFK